MTTVKDGLYQYGGVPVGGLISQGKAYHIKPGSGGAGGGLKINDAVDGLVNALSLMQADQNDVAYLYAEDNSASGTTDYLSESLSWNKDLTHIVGVNTGGPIGLRSRVAQLSTATGVTSLIDWSASSGSMRNVHIFHGVNDATSLVALKVSGSRNYFSDCHIAGIGHTAMDKAGAASLWVTGDENTFERCIIGVDTIGKGSEECSELLLSGGAARTYFKDCTFLTYGDADTHQFVIKAASGIDRWCVFENCKFINPVKSAATSLTTAFKITAGGSPNGLLLLKNCTVVGADDWDSGDTGELYIDGAAPTTGTSGIAINTTA